jgi:hypothetical protein
VTQLSGTGFRWENVVGYFFPYAILADCFGECNSHPFPLRNLIRLLRGIQFTPAEIASADTIWGDGVRRSTPTQLVRRALVITRCTPFPYAILADCFGECNSHPLPLRNLSRLLRGMQFAILADCFGENNLGGRRPP